MSKQIRTIIPRFILFIILGMLLVKGVSVFLIPKWNYPRFVEETTNSMKAFQKDGNNLSIDVFFLGTSHMEYGVSPLEMYKRYHLLSYNIATSGQPIWGSVYLVKEIFKKQTPKVVVFDASKMFQSNEAEQSYRYILDNETTTNEKKQLIKDSVADMWPNRGNTIHGMYTSVPEYVFSVLFPIYRYHDRWSEIEELDFKGFPKKYFRQGYHMSTHVRAADFTIQGMNDIQTERKDISERHVNIVENKTESNTSEEKELYGVQLKQKSIEAVLEMKEICESNGSKLLLVKIPSAGTFEYRGAWTETKSELVKEFAAEQGIQFLDLMYDRDLINWEEDTLDGGNHLNLSGARKVSLCLGEYLRDELGCKPAELEAYDRKLELYDRLEDIADLQMERNFPSYIQKLSDRKDSSVIILSARDEMTGGLSEIEKEQLKALGIETDLESIQFRDAFIAVLEQGESIYEVFSNQRCAKRIEFDSGVTANIVSSGWWEGSLASIKINDVEYALNERGLNIVVYDIKSGQVIDSAVVDTCVAEHDVKHSVGNKLYEYEQYLLDK